MKLKFSLKNKEASIEADVEGLVKKSMDVKAQNPDCKTRYQIRQEEKRKTEELKHKHDMQMLVIGIALLFVLLAICFIGAIFD